MRGIPELARIFRALGHPLRIHIIQLLSQAPLTYTQLARLCFQDTYAFDTGKFNYHLRYLRDARLIRNVKRAGKYVYELTSLGRKIAKIIIKKIAKIIIKFA